MPLRTRVLSKKQCRQATPGVAAFQPVAIVTSDGYMNGPSRTSMP
jgi:hypothetical protein